MTNSLPTAVLAQNLFTLGVMGFSKDESIRYGVRSTAEYEFTKLLDAAKKRGFASRKSLIGAARRGKATAGAVRWSEEAAGLLTADEVHQALARCANRSRFPW